MVRWKSLARSLEFGPPRRMRTRCNLVMVDADSVLTRSFPGCSMVAGAPKHLVKRYCPETQHWAGA
jgi:hypothetical protein